MSSWIVAGSYARRLSDAAIGYEAGCRTARSGISAAMPKRSRPSATAPAMSDRCTRSTTGRSGRACSRLRRQVRELRLSDRGSRVCSARGRASRQTVGVDPLRLHAAVSHREVAPGAEEFIPPATGLWLPPERTFSPVGHSGFLPERLDHIEVGAERDMGRGHHHRHACVSAVRRGSDRDALRCRDGHRMPTLGHYVVGSAGRRRGIRLGRLDQPRSSEIDFRTRLITLQSDAQRTAVSPSERRLLRVAPAVLRDSETIRIVTRASRASCR